MLGDEVLLDITGSLDFSGEEGVFFSRQALVTEEQGEQCGGNARGSEGADLKQGNAPILENIGHAKEMKCSQLGSEPHQVGQGPEHAQSGKRSDAVRDSPIRPERDKRGEREEDVKGKRKWTNEDEINGGEPARNMF